MKDGNTLLIPMLFLTVMFNSPGVVRAAVTQIMVVSSITLRDFTFKVSNKTELTPVKDFPVIITVVPPVVPP